MFCLASARTGFPGQARQEDSAFGSFWQAAVVEKQTYRETASTGGWRSLPWPFGLLDVEDDSLAIRSWHWSWWLEGRRVARDEIAEIDVGRVFTVLILRIRLLSGKPWKVHVANAPDRVLNDLRSRGYPLLASDGR
jgi:hypothetical protein